MSDGVIGSIPDHQMESMALIHAIRTLTSSIDRQASRQDGQEAKLDAIRDDIGEIKTRLAVIEHDSLGVQVAALREDVDKLKMSAAERKGAGGMVAMILKSPMVGWMVGGATFIWALLTGRIHL